MDFAARGAPSAPREFAQPGAVTRAISSMAAALAAACSTTALMGPRLVPAPVFAGAPASTVASMPARDTSSSGPDTGEPIRPRPHEIPHIDPDPGWSLPRPAHLPHPTYWPAVLAMGIVFLAWGLVTNVIVAAVGLVVFFVALIGWIGDLRHDS